MQRKKQEHGQTATLLVRSKVTCIVVDGKTLLILDTDDPTTLIDALDWAKARGIEVSYIQDDR